MIICSKGCVPAPWMPWLYIDLLSGKTVKPEQAITGTLVTAANLDDPANKAILFP